MILTTFPGASVSELMQRLGDACVADPDIQNMRVVIGDSNDLQTIEILAVVVLGPLVRTRRDTPAIPRTGQWIFHDTTVGGLLEKLAIAVKAKPSVRTMRVVLGSVREDLKTIEIRPTRESPTSEYDYVVVLR